jgi:non-homologous end joining protein Ku
VVLRDGEQIVLLRPIGKVLAMTFLNYAEAVKDPAQFEKEVLPVEVDPKELEVAKTLGASMTAEDPAGRSSEHPSLRVYSAPARQGYALQLPAVAGNCR